MDNEREEMIEQIKSILDHHTKSRHAVHDTLFRLFNERGGDFPALTFDTMKVEKVQRDVEWLKQLDRKHDREKNIDNEHEARPIIVVQYAGTLYLIDGNNRVNKWLRDGRSQPVDVYILEPG